MSVPGIPLVMGYCDPWVVAPGETIAFKVGTRDGARRYRASVVRVISSDTGPAGAGLKTENIAAPVNGARDGVPRPIPAGSFALVEHPRAIAGLSAFTIQALVQAMLPGQGPQAIVSSWTEGARESAFTLLVDEDGAAAIQFGDGRHGRRLSTGQGLRRDAWYHLAASYDGTTSEVFIRQTPLATRGFDRVPTAEAGGHVSAPPLAAASLRIGAIGKPGPDRRRFATWLFEGKIEAPSLADRAMSAEELRVNASVGTTAPPAGNVLAHWDFALDIAGTRISDIGPRFLHGETFNAPKRAVLGARWDGSVHDWRQNPTHYAAIHFHSDDIYDAAWPDEFTWRVPDDQRSGIYALKLEAEGGAPFWVTFFLRPPRGKATARAAFLASTATYQVYANYRARMKPSDTADLAMGAMQFVDTTDMLALVEPALGSSTYDKHPDGSGVHHASRMRPLTNVRPTGRLWNLQIDFCLLDFLEAQGIA